MNYLKRATTSIKRRPVKSLIFLFLVTLLASLTAGSITIRQAINHTDANLRHRMPSIMMVEAYDAFYAETGEWSLVEFPVLTPEMIREIADLDYVRFFDYTIDVGGWSVTSSDLEPWNIEGIMWPIMSTYNVGLGSYIRPRGVSTPEFIEARDGFLELVEGRTFTEDELNNPSDVTPVIISAELARMNNLDVGSTFDSRFVIWDEGEGGTIDGMIPLDEQGFEMVVDVHFPMVIIGLFEADLPVITPDMTPELGFPISNQNARVHHIVYLPNHVAEEMFMLRIENEQWWEDDSQPVVHHFFTLADPMYHRDFAHAIGQLEGDWQAIDLSTGFQAISASMENLNEIADFILMGAVVATILIISLVVLLFLRDRRHEVGVYLAMGDKKINIIKQMVLELIPLAMIGLTMALFIGNIVSSHLSQEIVRQDLMANPPTQESVQMGGQLENLGYRFNITHDQLLESYEISLDGGVVLAFYGIGIGVVIIATLVPIIFAVNVDPKKLLMEDQM